MDKRIMVPPTTSSPTALRVVDPETLISRMNELYDLIAQRAFEIFEGDGRPGRDQDNWFRAEQELLHPVHVCIGEADGALNIEAEVPGFNPDELQVSLEPKRLTIAGKKTSSRESKEKEETIYQERCSSEILRVIELPAEVDPAKASATLKNGVLDLKLPKAASQKAVQKAAVRAV
jgi:HSP20 family molecular chaperone IbpA